jgi:hypothetical protein
MDKQTAAVCLQFLHRTNLTGAEVETFQRVVAALANIAHGAVVMAPPASATVSDLPIMQKKATETAQ